MTDKNNKIRLVLLTILLVLVLAACGGNAENQATEDPNMAVTQVYETAMAALTQTAAVQPATPTFTVTNTEMPTATTAPTLAVTPTNPLPSSTSPSFIQPTTVTSSCDIGNFVRDVTIPDGTNMAPGQSFTKTWEIKNAGTCTWDANYTVVFYSGAELADDNQYSFTTADIEPGESVNISVPMKAPTTTGTYTSYWVMRNDLGQTFYINGGAIYVEITVGSVTPSPTGPTATPTATGIVATPTATTAPVGDVPVIHLLSPSNGATYTTSQTITFSATASDTEDGDISASIIWLDNNTQFDTGSSFTDTITTTGSHTIKVRITDSDGNVASEAVTITITN